MSKIIKSGRALVFILVPALCPFSLFAEDSVTGLQTTTTILEVEAIQSETVLYEAQLIRDKARHEINLIGMETPSVQAGAINASLDTSLSRRTPALSVPRLLEVYGTPGKMMAILSLPDGRRAALTVGQNIPGTEYRILSITDDSVWIQSGDVKQQLMP